MRHMISSEQYIAEKLLKINERRSWSDPPPEDPAARANQDEQIFQTAKLVKLVAAHILPRFSQTVIPLVAGTL
jgi:hypothetical protein